MKKKSLLKREKKKVINEKNGLFSTRWPNKTIPYIFDEKFRNLKFIFFQVGLSERLSIFSSPDVETFPKKKNLSVN